MPAPLSAADLYAADDSDVKKSVVSSFTAQLTNAPSVNGDIFNGSRTPVIDPVNAQLVDDVATALVSSAISRSSQFGFGATVDQARSDAYWSARLKTSDATTAGQALYASLFPDHCRSSDHVFSEYLAETGSGWGEQLAQHVTTDDFINVDMNRLIAGEPEWVALLNLVFYKIQRLDPSQVAVVLQVWRSAFPDEGITVSWQEQNYVPPVNWQPDVFLGQVSQAIAVKTWLGGPGDIGAGGDMYMYGVSVGHFVQSPSGPARLGLTTGRQPQNQVDENVRSGSIFGCFVAGTPVQLRDGTSVAIEAVQRDDEVIGLDGAIGVRSDERVVVPLPDGGTVYGFNDVEPFFSAGHLIRTRDGWKALSPATALEENADREVGQLAVGDVVLRLIASDPVQYEEAVIETLTERRLPAGSELYGLHLHGARSYHANGFCVGMNFPVITEHRLTDGFSRLTAEERRLVHAHLSAVAPLLERAIGRFVTGPLERAVIARHDRSA